MPFGVCNAPSAFMRLMHHVLRGLEKYVVVYIDEICVFSANEQEHLVHLQTVLQRLRQ